MSVGWWTTPPDRQTEPVLNLFQVPEHEVLLLYMRARFIMHAPLLDPIRRRGCDCCAGCGHRADKVRRLSGRVRAVRRGQLQGCGRAFEDVLRWPRGALDLCQDSARQVDVGGRFLT
ncbi:hypothetical protein BHE74_00015590 [Ensete ventricosum]|nr:hypothetical protein GW17_00008928 [Ensete ventricosum]RWW76330.1 hypothetical protein BHE74_00015590 [Ensete ventricosum]RZS03488.1 hypothetical protein BHM03_00033671 [Ensete ventricosum]